jgi:hypothetical protein
VNGPFWYDRNRLQWPTGTRIGGQKTPKRAAGLAPDVLDSWTGALAASPPEARPGGGGVSPMPYRLAEGRSLYCHVGGTRCCCRPSSNRPPAIATRKCELPRSRVSLRCMSRHQGLIRVEWWNTELTPPEYETRTIMVSEERGRTVELGVNALLH